MWVNPIPRSFVYVTVCASSSSAGFAWRAGSGAFEFSPRTWLAANWLSHASRGLGTFARRARYCIFAHYEMVIVGCSYVVKKWTRLAGSRVLKPEIEESKSVM
jgi:hypothetical protein